MTCLHLLVCNSGMFAVHFSNLRREVKRISYFVKHTANRLFTSFQGLMDR